MSSFQLNRLAGWAAMLGGLGWVALLPLFMTQALGPDFETYVLLARILLVLLAIGAVGLARRLAAENDWAESVALRVGLGGLVGGSCAFLAAEEWHLPSLALLAIPAVLVGVIGLVIWFRGLHWSAASRGFLAFDGSLVFFALIGLEWAFATQFSQVREWRHAWGGVCWMILGYHLWADGRGAPAEAANRERRRVVTALAPAGASYRPPS